MLFKQKAEGWYFNYLKTFFIIESTERAIKELLTTDSGAEYLSKTFKKEID